MKKSLTFLNIAMAMVAGSEKKNFSDKRHSKKTSKNKPIKVIPKGCKEYHFTAEGEIVQESSKDIKYSCIAMSQQKAIEKFKATTSV